MFRITINAYQVGLKFVDGVYKEMLREGKYWKSSGERIDIYQMEGSFVPAMSLDILLRDEKLAEMLQVVEVGDHEIALQYENGRLKQILKPGQHAFWKSLVRYEFVKADLRKIGITEPIDRATLAGPQIGPFVRTISVEAYEKAVLFIEGKFSGVLEGGVYYFWKNSIAVYVGKIDTRQQQLEVNGQEILTKDKAALRINAWAQYRVADIEKALLQNREYEKQLYVAVQLGIRELIGTFALDELLEKKDTALSNLLERLQTVVQPLGVEVLGLGIRDIILPGDMKEILNQVLMAEKKAQANWITRREETASTRSLLNTAKLMEDNPMLFKLKEMEYVEKIAEKISSISVNGSGDLVGQLKQIFIPQK